MYCCRFKMIIKFLLMFTAALIITKCEDLQFLTKSRTTFLAKYRGYEDVVLLHTILPPDTTFASFLFTADEMDLSFFGCSPRNVSLFIKFGAPPVINPDGSKFPDLFRNITRSSMYELKFQTDKTKKYINITSPQPGPYFMATFLSYTNPKYNSIQQEGLGPRCMPYVESIVYVEKLINLQLVLENQQNEVVAASVNESKIYKFYIPESIDHVILEMDEITFAKKADALITRIQSDNLPSNDDALKIEKFSANVTAANILFWVQENTWTYIEFIFNSQIDNKINKDNTNTSRTVKDVSTLKFQLKFFSNEVLAGLKSGEKSDIETTFHNKSLLKTHRSNKLTEIVPYKQYNLVRESTSDNFVFSYQLLDEVDSMIPIAINVTSQHFTALKFHIRDGSDIGGTLQYILAFKPRLKNKLQLENEPADHVLVGCIRSTNIEVPTWPNKCLFNGVQTVSPLILNNTVDNATVLIPYPESGTWYATFRLFCGTCKPCNCPEKCQKMYESCTIDCERNCDARENCSNCVLMCSQQTFQVGECKSCDCDGPCQRNEQICNTSVVFDVSSQPCISGECSKNGRCMFLMSSSIVYSSCMCTNKYRGWDCSDNSLATPYATVVLELVLLVLSNLMFLPSVYVAYTRQYYVEALTYFAICFFSTFYHACDAGENVISFCMTRLSALQFGDFFCALLAIWMTLLAIADLPAFWPSICQVLGAIVLAFCTTIDKTSLWVFAVPAVSGLLVICVNWYMKYRKIKQMFVSRRYICIYVPVGATFVVVGLVIYSILQTEDNYKYLHSMWHMIMAIAVIILLPTKNTFLPETLL